MAQTYSGDDWLISNIMNNPISWILFILFIIILNTISWYYRYTIIGNTINHTGNANDLIYLTLFRVFEFVCIISFGYYIFKYGNK